MNWRHPETCSGPVRVVFLIDQLEAAGGTECHLLDLVSSIDRERVEPSVVVLGAAGMAPRVAACGVPAETLGVTSLRGVDGLWALSALVQALRRHGPELVVTYHPSSDLLGPLGARIVGARPISSRRDLGFTRKGIHRTCQRPVNMLVEGMVAVSQAVRAQVARDELFALERIRVIPNGCDLDRFHPALPDMRRQFGIPEGALVVGTLANFHPVKGYDVVLPAALELVQRCGDLYFLLAGGPVGPDHGVDRYREMAASAGGRIVFAGERNAAAVLASMDVFLQASHSEGFSNSIVQAMACGRPVVVTDVGGNPEIVDRRCGILVPPATPSAVVTAVSELLGSASLRRRMGEAARARVAERFSKALMLRRYEEALAFFAGRSPLAERPPSARGAWARAASSG